MTSLLSATALWLTLAAADPAAATSSPAATPSQPSPGAPRDRARPPPGSKAEQALWQAGSDVYAELVAEQYAAARLTQGAKGSGFQQRLEEAARSGALPQDRANDLSRRLVEKWVANVELMQAQWPVSKTRVCGYELLNFEVLMGGGGTEAQREDARGTLAACVDRARPVLGRLRASNAELRSVLAEVEKALAALPPAATTAPAAKAAPAPSDDAKRGGPAAARPD